MIRTLTTTQAIETLHALMTQRPGPDREEFDFVRDAAQGLLLSSAEDPTLLTRPPVADFLGVTDIIPG